MTEQPQAIVSRDEGQLVSEAKAGNYSAFEELVNRYEKKIYRLGMNITGNREDAEDVLQDAFLKAFEPCRISGGLALLHWITRIAVNEALMKLCSGGAVRKSGWRTLRMRTETFKFGVCRLEAESRQLRPNGVGTYSPDGGQFAVSWISNGLHPRDVEDLSTEEPPSYSICRWER